MSVIAMNNLILSEDVNSVYIKKYEMGYLVSSDKPSSDTFMDAMYDAFINDEEKLTGPLKRLFNLFDSLLVFIPYTLDYPIMFRIKDDRISILRENRVASLKNGGYYGFFQTLARELPIREFAKHVLTLWGQNAKLFEIKTRKSKRDGLKTERYLQAVPLPKQIDPEIAARYKRCICVADESNNIFDDLAD